ncbi:MAG: ParA family protein [Marinospirillum sp.]|uniref:ParA family protein n=1 Tax=Marinospirillum sp. TaxID=2183934 RepID=UPI0019FA43C0|nr:ParA family protein [Marinospirillum sp.]MBE0507527.1 ParA family protein [Marinospirillum sp.]
MKILFSNYKGGVGKSSIAYNMTLFAGFHYVTNDTTILDDPDTIRIEPRLKRIPKEIKSLGNVVYDFGAMSTQVDPKVTHALSFCDLVVIPTLTDQRSIQATIDFIQFIKGAGVPYVVIINNYTQQQKCERASNALRAALGTIRIMQIKHTTLFERVAEHGRNWLYNVHERRGLARLIKTRDQHDAIYREILALGGVDVADS